MDNICMDCLNVNICKYKATVGRFSNCFNDIHEKFLNENETITDCLNINFNCRYKRCKGE
jgi:hypothetical protein